MARHRYRGRTRRTAHRLCWLVLIGTAALLYGAVLVETGKLIWLVLESRWDITVATVLGLAVVGAVGLREG